MNFFKTLNLSFFTRCMIFSAVFISATLYSTIYVLAASIFDPGRSPTPDLSPTPITYSQPLTVGSPIYFDSGIKNGGRLSAPSSSFTVKWFVNGVQVGYGPHDGILGNTTVMNGNSNLIYTFPAPGNYTITFQVDSDNNIREANENNNKTSINVFLYPVDLAPTQISCSIPYPKVRQQLTFNTSIQNTGYSPSGIFNIAWYVNDTPVAAGGHSSIPGNTTIDNGNSQLDYNFTTPGVYKITVEVNPDKLINEAFDGNNKTSLFIDVTS